MIIRILFGVASVLFTVPQVFAQTVSEDEKLAAYQIFHQGKVRQAATQLKAIAEGANTAERILLQRDILEVCAEGYDWECVAQTIKQMLPAIQKEPKFAIIYPDIILYEAKRARWFEDDVYFARMLANGGPSKVASPVPHAALFSELALITHSYLLEKGETRSAEELRSSAILGLLLTDPKKTYAISKVLVDLIEALLNAQDIVGAFALASDVEAFLVKSINHGSALYARYRFIIGQLMAFTNAHGLTVTSLLEAARLFGQLEIDEGVKLHRSALANSLASAALALDGKLGEARTLHSQHPLHSLRDEIFSRSEFQTSTEFYFGVSDVFLAALVAKEHPDRRWLHLFEREPDWKLSDLERMNFNSYRSFALGLIRMAEGHREIARDMLLAAATQRLSIFSQFQRTSAENFHLPSLVDKIVIAVGLASAVEKGGNDSIEIILRGSELLSRNLRHHLVDAAALLASQPNPGARRRAHAFIHLLGKKREWELDKIRKLVSNDGIEQLRGVVLEHYTKAVGKIAELKQKIRFNSAPENSSGLQQLQRSLQPRQAYVGYFPFLGGVGKLCVTAENWKIATAPYDLSIIDDVKTLASAVMQFPRNAKEAAQYPTAAAVRINQFLFGGLESCLTPGTHVTVALPPEFTSVPLGALLRDERGLRDGKLDLRNAHWLINDLSFSIVLSAQHHLATSSDQSRDAGQRAYLGIGDPHLDGDHRTALASTKLFRGSLKTPHGVLDFSPLPETSDELEAVGKLFGANSQDILVGKRGTEEAFRARPLGEYDVIHFATHGLVSTDLAGLADSALILTPTSSLDTYDDGLLSATEISRLSLNARMVVLSACNTAKYDVAQATRGVQDLQAAFTVAGAPTLIASLWPVDSLATKDLITNFLRQWRSANSRGAAEALAKTIRAHIVDADNLHRHPSYWAPFVVVGNGGVVGARSTQMSQRAPAFEFLNGFSDGGEIYHVAQVGSDALVSLIGEWDGSKMNGITSRRSLGGAEKWRVGSREIGSGRVSVFADYIYAAGYTTTKNPVPVVRAFTLDGRLRWKTEYPDLTGYLFSDIISNSSGALIVAYPHLVPTTEPKDVLVLSIKKDGTLRRKTNIGPRLSNINLGSPALITHWNNRVVVVINSGQTSKLKFDKKTIAGLPTICWEGAVSTIYELDSDHRVLSTRAVNSFRASSLVAVEGSLFLGGDLLESCWIKGTASVVRLSQSGEVRRIWTDDDVFTTSVRGMTFTGRQLLVAVGHERTLGMPSEKQRPVEDYGYKRWSEDVATAMEASVLRLSRDGEVVDRRYIAGGLGMFFGGIAAVGERTVAYGSMGGVPGYATFSQNARSRKRFNTSPPKHMNSTWQVEVHSTP